MNGKRKKQNEKTGRIKDILEKEQKQSGEEYKDNIWVDQQRETETERSNSVVVVVVMMV